MSKPIIGHYATQPQNYKRATDTRNLIKTGPVFPWHQRAVRQVISILSAIVRGL